jgi:hypothetical protein
VNICLEFGNQQRGSKYLALHLFETDLKLLFIRDQSGGMRIRKNTKLVVNSE